MLSDRLTRLGYAVLRVDDRGVGGSTGNVVQSELTDIAQDVRGMLDFLEREPAIDRAMTIAPVVLQLLETWISTAVPVHAQQPAREVKTP